MWETFISWYINNYLGQYVENLNSQQLSLALSKGELELENVPLKKNIFRNWGLPVEVKSGVVGRIKIEFNILKYFRNEPVLISIEDVYLVAGPIDLSEWDFQEEDALAHESKMSSLESHEARWKTQFDLQQQSETSSYYSSLYVSSMRIGASIVTKVVENLQLNVSNVHIRFEQEIGKSNRLVAFGITLQSLSVQSCDGKWNPLSSSTTPASDSSHKTLKISKLGVYCDTRAERMSHLKSPELNVAMSKYISHHHYLLSPVSAEARVTKDNCSHPLTNVSKPRFDVHLTLEKVPLQLSDGQYKYSYKSYKAIRKLNRNCRLRHYRPFTSVKENPVDWWVYATQAVLSLRGFKRRKKLRTWEEVLARARDNCEYSAAYQSHLIGEILSGDARKLKDRMEQELHFDDIIELRQLAMKRIEKFNKSTNFSTALVVSSNTTTGTDVAVKQSNSGLLSWMFPSWSGCTAPQNVDKIDKAVENIENIHDHYERNNTSNITSSESDFDEAILGEMKAFGRDSLLARFNFILNQGAISLTKKTGSFLELDFGGVGVEFSLKPRSGSHKFQMSLSSLALKDIVTKSAILIPHTSQSSQAMHSKSPKSTVPLFNFIYEMKPHRKAGHRVTVSTRPMDLILNPLTWDEVGRFFSIKSEEDYLEIPYNGYEAMKQKTKEELQVYWERIINQKSAGENDGSGSSWEIYMDIFAPQITIFGSSHQQKHCNVTHQNLRENWRPNRLLPQELFSSSTAVIIDLGRFRFTNIECEDRIMSPDFYETKNDDGKTTENSVSDDDENEEFLTPCSSPVPEMSESPMSSPRQSIVDPGELPRNPKEIDSFGSSLDEIHAKFYKKYTLEIADVQVIVIDHKFGKDSSWKPAILKGTSLLHLIDRFSINLQMERRLVYSEDPLWPAITLVGTLPKLTFHVNESKVMTLRSVFNAFSTVESRLLTQESSADISFLSGSQINLQEADKSQFKFSESATGMPKNISKLFVAEFNINNISVDLQSRGRNIAELQIVGTKTILTHREDDTEFSFVIQSLLLADAVQLFGPDFQLLLASHRHVCVDSVSGSLKDSEPTSPMSPVSPPSPMPSTSAFVKASPATLEIPLQLHDALVSSLQSRKKTLISSIGSQTPVLNSDALITVDVVLTNKEEELAIVTVQFNNLDIIANQETMLEIFQFLQYIFPSSDASRNIESKNSETSIINPSIGRKIQANFEFHRLNLLLLRGAVGKDGSQIARKIATATASDARVNFVLHNSMMNIDGSLGGLQVINLTPEGHRHQRILSVGQDPLVDASYNPFNRETEFQFSIRSVTNESALTFTFEKDGNDSAPTIVLRMASVIYNHCSIFLYDLKKCVDQFQTPLATSLKSAATQIALGLVRQETTGNYRSPFGSFSGSLEKLDIDDVHGRHERKDSTRELRSIVKLDVVLNSPIIVLPRSRESPEVLVAHLGQISIKGCNGSVLDDNFFESELPDKLESTSCTTMKDGTIKYSVFICDISLYSLNLKNRWKMMENFKMTNPDCNTATLMRAQDLYRCDSPSAIPILHNTVIQFNVLYMDENIAGTENDTFYGTLETETYDIENLCSRLEIQGRVISSLKVSLTPQQYSQLLDSISNIAIITAEDDFDDFTYIERKISWEKETSSFKKGSSDQGPLPSPSRMGEDTLVILSCFEIPELIVELVLPEENHVKKTNQEVPSLSLSCSELSFNCDRRNHVTEINVCLKALKLEDTNTDSNSWRRVLAISRSDTCNRNLSKSTLLKTNAAVSSSCPDLRKSKPIPTSNSLHVIQHPGAMESVSLPEELDPSEIFTGRCFQSCKQRQSKSSTRKRRYSTKQSLESSLGTHEFCPVTPPPSPRPYDDEVSENLVHIQFILTDHKSQKFMTEFGGNHKHVKIDFNTLEVLLTPLTFSCLRKFFSDASKDKLAPPEFKQSQPQGPQSVPSFTKRRSPDSKSFSNSKTFIEERNSETVIKVKALSVKLAGSKGHVAEAEVSNVSCELKSRGNEYFGVEGRLGSLEVRDTTAYSGLYPLKFLFQGHQALDFDYARTGLDGRFRLTMSSIVCVHTHKFYSEFMSLWTSLFGNQPNDNLKMSNLNLSQADIVETEEKTRIILDIQAGAPVVILPYSSTSEKLLVADLGHLAVRNKFLDELEDLTFNFISIDLIQMDLYSGELIRKESPLSSAPDKEESNKFWNMHKGWAVVKTQECSSFLQKQCALSLKVRRVFDGVLDEAIASTRVQGVLSTVYCTVDPEKYKLIRGLLAHNIGENLDDSLHLSMPDQSNSKPHLSKKSSSMGSSKVDLNIELDLVNVTLEVLKENEKSLGRVDFIKSKFTFQNMSDGSKDVDLASQEILISDSRFDKKSSVDPVNIFTNILQQSTYPTSLTTGAASSISGKSGEQSMFHTEIPLQAEIHYRQTHRGSNVTIVLNNMRLMMILDWWIEVRDFLSQDIPKPLGFTASTVNESVHFGKNASPLLERSRDLSSPVTVSAGIVTKRAQVLDIPQSIFELKINISNCELIVVEKASIWDTNALILKGSAVLGYRPHLERPISCSLQQCELFSCILGLEAETALSIVDPTNIHVEVVRQTTSEPQGILDATFSLASSGKVLRIQSPNVSLRLSYHDLKMFVRLMDKFSKEAKDHFMKSGSQFPSDLEFQYMNTNELQTLESDVSQLIFMGFDRDNALGALRKSKGSLEDAVSFLTNSLTNDEMEYTINEEMESIDRNSGNSTFPHPQRPNETMSSIHGVEIKCNCFSLCVIDDCKDSDVPLVELSVQQLELSQNHVENCGTADCIFSGDYYNRGLSGWEPFLEPWRCNIKWKKNLMGQLDDYSPSSEFPSRAPAIEVLISSRTIMEINITSTLLNLYKTVSSNWTEDYEQYKVDKRRAPFIPFALRNETGSTLWFCTIISNNEELIKQQRTGDRYSSDTTSWIEVAHQAVQNFSFEGRGKLRHRNTHQLKTHQLAVRVDGWHEVTPISVDRVGTYFRVARPETSLRRYGGFMELPPTRLVLEVSLQGSAQKIVTVRSALMIKNSLPDPVELKLENTIVYPSFEKAQTGGSYIVQVQPEQVYPVPLHSVWAHMWIRPIIPEDDYPLLYLYCTKALLVGNSQEGVRECIARTPELTPSYRFCVAVKRNEFPADCDEIIPQNSMPNIVQLMSLSKRANLITLLSPFELVNLLPHEISYEIKDLNIRGRIAPGKTDRMSNVDPTEQMEINIQVDNFPQGVSIQFNTKSNILAQRVKMHDLFKRTLLLTAKLLKEDCGVMTVLLSCPCWVVNKSGLPLLCKQEGTTGEAAGQFQEHEVGRMVTPLMMSFPDQEGTESLTLRVGTALHKDSKPFWCRSFLCQTGVRVRKLTVSHCNNTPESVYVVGVEIRNGTGRYRDTKLVVVSPRFIVDNRSSFKIQISQRAYATSFFDAKAEATHLSLPSGCNLPFHYPRLDKEQLLCVRLNEFKGSSWSGGFPIDNVDSFHINIREAEGNCHFLRVEIVMQGPSYFVIFSDTTQLPPPFRIDNFSLVPVIFHQTCLSEERLKITSRSESSLPYALDEPTQPAHFTIAAPGGTSIIVNMDDLRLTTQLTYENFFYIALSATFTPDERRGIPQSGMESLQLVLDVPEGTKVILSKKEPCKRSQLWRVNADGLIEHEGSSPPRDLRKPLQEGNLLVLDIAGPAPLPTQCVPLMLRKPDKRRISTQHWEFTIDGRLKCRMYENLFVQAKDGFGTSNLPCTTPTTGAWKLWNDVVLGPSQPVCYIRTDSGIPAEQAVARQKLRPGSGMLNLAVETDGPTRVLRIIDVEHPPRHHLLHHTFEDNDYNTTPKYRIKVDLQSGFGVSIISCNPREELLHGLFSGFALEWTDTKNSSIVKASVMNLQIDNQLLESEKSASIYIATSSRSETVEDFTEFEVQPALHLYWESMKSNLNARVFKVWELVVKPLTLILEERLLLKLSTWLGFGQQVQSLDMLQQSDFEVQKALTSTASCTTRRYYFGMLKIILNQVKLSVLTSSKLSPDLAAVKRRLGLTLIRFEDANVELDPFEKNHPFETFEFLWALVVKHYRDELVSQAAVILGSTDFLGNPLGFVNDVSEGVSLMIYEGSVGALVKNVAHGLSNSAAKVTGTLGEGLGKTIMDDKHEEERRRIKEEYAGSSGEYLYAGLKGFGHGLIGGVTSMVAQSYEGASNDGITGLFTGFTKGIVGTITKPAVGVLDLATGAASAIRDSSKTSSRMIPLRIRPTRVVMGNGGLLPVYSEMGARGQELLYELNDKNFKELYIACETLKSGPSQDLRIMISSEAVTIFRPGKGNPVILKVPLSELIECQITTSIADKEKVPYIELARCHPDMQAPSRPQVVCENEQVAKRVVKQVNYAKILFEEMRHSQIDSRGIGED